MVTSCGVSGKRERGTDPQMATRRCRRGLHRLRTLRRGLRSRLSGNPEPDRRSDKTGRLRQRRALHPRLSRRRHPYGLGSLQRRPFSRLLAIRRIDRSRILLRARRNTRLTPSQPLDHNSVEFCRSLHVQNTPSSTEPALWGGRWACFPRPSPKDCDINKIRW